MSNKDLEIDSLDLRLLSILEEDARQTLSQIAKKLRSSQQVVSYRMKALEKKGVIGGYYSLIDIGRLGYTSYRTLLRLSNLSKEAHAKIIVYLQKHPNVLWVVDCGGRWDLLVNFMARDVVQYNELLQGFRKAFPHHIQNYDVLITVEGIYFGRDYLAHAQRKDKSLPTFGGQSHSREETDETDTGILRELAEHGRINAVEIAEKLKISPNTVILRMKALRKRGILQTTKPLLHLENMGYLGYKALIKFQNITETKEKELFSSLYSRNFVVGILKMVGAWDFEIEFEVSSNEQMLQFVRELRDEFKEIIKELEILPLYHEYRYNFFPNDLR